MASTYKWIKLCLTCIVLFALTACSMQTHYAPVVNGGYVRGTPSGLYSVKRGDTLYSIAWSTGQDYRTLAHRNGIRYPYDIHPGQVLLIKSGARKATSARKTVAKKSTWRPKPKKKVYRAKPKAQKYSKKTKKYNKPKQRWQKPKKSAKQKTYQKRVKSKQRYHKLGRVSHWNWPAQGKVVTNYAPWKNSKGIDIAGRSGSPIKATASGIVVYSGQGISGYGKLIIIKHNSTYLSAYAHNKKILVKEGQYVKAGQTIALMGHTGTKRVMLHFEIRKAGKPVNPMKYLPRR